MNAVEIEQAISDLAETSFDAAEFPYAFLAAFGNKETTLKRLRSGATNKSDVAGAVLQRNNIHLAACEPGQVGATLTALRKSPETTKQKVKYILATDGQTIEAENLAEGETLACDYGRLSDHLGFFLTLAGITTVKEIRENAFDIKATGRLNRLYIELLKANPDWDSADRREALNQFFARLIFCFFAEDTGILGDGLFTRTVETMSAPDSSNTHEVIAEVFRAMNIRKEVGAANPDHPREAAGVRKWAWPFPYVNGGLFSQELAVPRFNKIARSYLIHIGHLDWTKINPDIFGSMIQAVAEDEERGELGMHYTSVPNILKVLNPLFLDELREQLGEAGDGSDQGSKRKLLNLRNRMARIRIFDPACGSGNFLVIAYKEMRAIEAEINRRRGEPDRKSEIPLTNFRGIEIRHFASEIARLALIIAEYQCDVLYRGQKLALAEFLPLEAANWITHGNALRLDWRTVCPPTGTGVKVSADDLFHSPLDQAEIDFDNEGGETYICGNPPYLGKGKKSDEHLADMDAILGRYTKKYGYVDYVGCWFIKAAEYLRHVPATCALVATNSICQGRQLPQLWPHVLSRDIEIFHAHHSFKWSNSAARNAGVICVIVGISPRSAGRAKTIASEGFTRAVSRINAYLIEGDLLYVLSRPSALSSCLQPLVTGSVPNDGGHLIIDGSGKRNLLDAHPEAIRYVHPFGGSDDYLNGQIRYCLIISDDQVKHANRIPEVQRRLVSVRSLRSESPKQETREQLAPVPHRFQHRGPIPSHHAVIVPSVSAAGREWFPVGLLPAKSVVSNLAFLIDDGDLWQLGLLASRIHVVWVATVCGKLKTDPRYSNTLGWNTFPVPPLTEQNRADLTRCAENILLARESYWPATIADMYDPDAMVRDYPDLRAAHEANDETLERIYIGRRFKNDTERLEKLFEMYTRMIEREKAGKDGPKIPGRRNKA